MKFHVLKMPHLKKLQNVVIQIVLLLSLVAVTVHLISNYRERHAMQNDISHIRHSLHNLKDTINNIGITYDKLYNEIRSFVTEDANLLEDEKHSKKSLDKATDQGVINKLLVLENLNDGISNLGKDKIKRFVLQATTNATTVTRNPLKATGVGSEPLSSLPQCPIIKECQKYQSKSNIHKCYNNYRTCSCNYSYWKL